MTVEITLRREDGSVVVSVIGDATRPLAWETYPGQVAAENREALTGFHYTPYTCYSEQATKD